MFETASHNFVWCGNERIPLRVMDLSVPKGTRGKVLVAMSGGVDSSVAAALLQRDGYDCVGVFMRLGSPGETLDELEPAEGGAARGGGMRIGHQGCCSINDAADARLVAAQLGIPFYVVNFRREFGRIIDYFVGEYAAGRTPNPCVRCNDWLKFGRLHEYAGRIGATHIASGHYASISEDGAGRARLSRGVDRAKDQSYVLFGMPREQLGRTLLPVGSRTKAEIRGMARAWGLPVFDKPDSQEICFVPDNDYAGLVERRRPEVARPGDLLDESGARIGTHEGQHRFTIGQRRGVGVAFGRRVYVVGKDAAANTVTLGPSERLLVASCVVGEANWLVDVPSRGWFAVHAQYRAHGAATPARARIQPDAAAGSTSGRAGRFEVEFEGPQGAVAPGQALVLYDGAEPDVVLGGGWIESAVSP